MFIGAHGSRGLEFIFIMAGNMITSKQAWLFPGPPSPPSPGSPVLSMPVQPNSKPLVSENMSQSGWCMRVDTSGCLLASTSR